MPHHIFWKAASAVIVAVVLSSCAGSSFNWDQARSIKTGMTEAQLVDVMGKPYMVTARGDSQIWVYSHANAFAGAKSVSFILKDGRVVETPVVPQAFN